MNGSKSPQGNRIYCDKCTIARERRQAIAAEKKRERCKKRNKQHTRINKKHKTYIEGFLDKGHQEPQVYNFCTRFISSLCMALKKRGFTRENVSLRETLGVPPQKAWEHLISTYEVNYGERWSGQPYEMDHIVPLCTTRTKKGILALYHYTNLQMLTPKDNRSKNNDLRWKSPYQKTLH